MNFSNNAEMMGFEKAGWTRFLVTPEKDGVQTILAGKPLRQGTEDYDPYWCIRRMEINTFNGFQHVYVDYIENRPWEEVIGEIIEHFNS